MRLKQEFCYFALQYKHIRELSYYFICALQKYQQSKVLKIAGKKSLLLPRYARCLYQFLNMTFNCYNLHSAA